MRNCPIPALRTGAPPPWPPALIRSFRDGCRRSPLVPPPDAAAAAEPEVAGGEHLLLPGYDDSHPTLEIFSYDSLRDALPPEVNRPGFAHIAFEVDDVETTLAEIVAAGGGQVGEIVAAAYPNDMEAVFVYARDPEGNIIELQSWRKMQTNS